MTVHSRWCVSISLSAIVIFGPAALAQSYQSDYERLRRDGIERNDAAARAHSLEAQRQLQERERQAERDRQSNSSSPSFGGGHTPSPSGYGAGAAIDLRAQGKEMLRLPPLPDARNVLLGRWRLESGGQQSGAAGLVQGARSGGGTGAGAGLGELVGILSRMDQDKVICDVSFGGGITFTPSTYSSDGVAGMAGGPVAYRSRNPQVIVAIPGDSRANPMPFTIAGPNRIVYADTCALVRVGAPGANAAAARPDAPTASANSASAASERVATPTQMANAVPVPTRSTPSRPSREICVNTFLDKLGTVGVNQVRAMSDARFSESPIEGKVPNTNNLRLDLRGSACDDPRIKATLYDFDANSMLQSITFVWDRPSGPAPAPIFQERVRTLAVHHAGLPQPQSPGRLQGDTSLGRLILQDMPERNLLLEAYAARK